MHMLKVNYPQLIIVFFSLLICILTCGCSKEEVIITENGETEVVKTEKDTVILDPFEYYNVVFTGYNGYGTVSLEKSSQNTENRFFSFRISKSYDLSNGEKICVTVDTNGIYNDPMVIISPAYKEFEVQGLEELTEIDPFESLEIQFDGISPYITVSYNTSKCPSIISDNVLFETDSKYFRIGDTFSVRAAYNGDMIGKKGYIISANTQDYVVNNVPKYLSAFEEADLTELDNLINDYVEAQAYKSITNEQLFDTAVECWVEPDIWIWGQYQIDSINSISCEKEYFLSLKTPTNIDSDKIYNKYIRIYEIGFTAHKSEKTLNGKAYVAIFMDNIVIDTDGTLKYSSTEMLNADLLYHKSEATIDIIETSCVIAEKAKYNVSEIN